MDKLSQFHETIKTELVATLATAFDKSVTMRVVSPVPYEGGILIFTAPNSKKYAQLKGNPNCCIACGGFFAECHAEFLGGTMLECNTHLREAYSAKFQGAFDEGIAFGGRDAEFILLRPVRLSGWGFANDAPTPDGIPNVPFEIEL